MSFYRRDFLTLLFTGLLGMTGSVACASAAHGVVERQGEVSFSNWLAAVKKEAQTKGISDETIESAFADVKPIPRIIELDRGQPEFKLTFDQYYQRMVNKHRILRARAIYMRNKQVIDQIAQRFEIPPRYLVALWGVESDFGKRQGKFPVIDVLSTLAFDGRRPDYFRAELFQALAILDHKMVSLEKLKGSWAGAMGQTQFMPTTFLTYAVDFDEDGAIDIWTSSADAVASGANYLKNAGWKAGDTWGREVSVPEDLDPNMVSLDLRKSLEEWQIIGVRMPDGRDLPGAVRPAALVKVDEDKPRYFLVYNNFFVVREWNKSNFFALSVCLFANSLGF